MKGISLRISITKETLKQSMWCGVLPGFSFKPAHCAIANALKDIFPDALVFGGSGWLLPFPDKNLTEVMFMTDAEFANLQRSGKVIELPPAVKDFIIEFDLAKPYQRPYLPEISFEIELPEWVIERIDISGVTNALRQHPNLEIKKQSFFKGIPELHEN